MSTNLPQVFCALLLGIACLPAAEIPVGSPDEFEAAVARAQPGDVLLLPEATWRDATLVFHAGGAAEAPITLRAVVPGKFVLSGESSLRIGGAHLVIDGLIFKDGFSDQGHVISFRGKHDQPARHCRLTNTAIINYNPPPGPEENSSYWVSLYGEQNRVDHCLLQGKNDRSPTLTVWVGEGPNGHRIDHNVFKDRPDLGKNGGETIRVGTSDVSMTNSRTIVEFNYFENCDGEVEIISNKSCENIYRANTFRASAGALVLRHGNRCLVEGNWFFGEGKKETGGVRIIGEDHRVVNNYFHGLRGDGFRAALSIVEGQKNSPLNGYFQVCRALIGFNTFIDCEHNLVIAAGAGERGRSLPPLEVQFAYNLFQSESSPLVQVLDPAAQVTWTGNSGLDAQYSQAAADPAKPLGDFAFVTEDIEGRSRDLPYSVGAIEDGAPAGTRKPMTANEAGPEWLRE
jgi:poly(beta-D-mannuronate) lyase